MSSVGSVDDEMMARRLTKLHLFAILPLAISALLFSALWTVSQFRWQFLQYGSLYLTSNNGRIEIAALNGFADALHVSGSRHFQYASDRYSGPLHPVDGFRKTAWSYTTHGQLSCQYAGITYRPCVDGIGRMLTIPYSYFILASILPLAAWGLVRWRGRNALKNCSPKTGGVGGSSISGRKHISI